MTKFNTKERATALFIQALANAGFQHSSGSELDMPKYFRGIVTEVDYPVYLNFIVTDNMALKSADNKTQIRGVYIDGSLYSQNGSGDEEYQMYANALENACAELGIELLWEGENEITPVDISTPIYYCNFGVTIKI